MSTDRTRSQTLFFSPVETTQNTRVGTRGQLWNASTQRWIKDTPRNRTRLARTAPVRARIRNPRTGR